MLEKPARTLLTKITRHLREGKPTRASLIGCALIVSAIAVTLVLFDTPAYATLDQRLTNVQTLFKGPVAKTGMTVATVVATAFAAAKQSIGAAVAVMGVGIGLSYYLGWLTSDNFGQ